MGSKIIAVDVGGTFIDVVSIDRETGAVSVEKQPSTPDRLAEELLTALERLPGTLAEIDRFLHGSTVAINALVQREGAKVGLITTRGFRDVLELARGNRPHIYDWVWMPPEPLVPRELRREVTERLGPRGDEVAPLDLAGLAREADALVAAGADAIAVCFLHAYANPKHEREAAEVIERRLPGFPVTLSSDVAAEWHEYERTSTAVINAYVQPSTRTYLGSLRDRLDGAGMRGAIGVMQSNGGVMAAERAVELPVRTLSSGPAGGVVGVATLARRLGHPDAICTDVGGTTYDVAIIEGGRVQERTESEIAGLPVLAPTVDVASIGAGGGSIAWIDDLGGLRVGPVSAGARPGPACFGFGGVEPTVTDCHLVLGRLDPDRFLGSRMHLDLDAAEQAISERVATPLGMRIEDAAEGVLRIVETAMANAIHSMTVERGIDPRTFALYAYGGAGGLFAAATATELDIPTIVVPREPATFSAWGILGSEYREDVSTTRVLQSRRRSDAERCRRARFAGRGGRGSAHGSRVRRRSGRGRTPRGSPLRGTGAHGDGRPRPGVGVGRRLRAPSRVRRSPPPALRPRRPRGCRPAGDRPLSREGPGRGTPVAGMGRHDRTRRRDPDDRCSTERRAEPYRRRSTIATRSPWISRSSAPRSSRSGPRPRSSLPGGRRARDRAAI